MRLEFIENDKDLESKLYEQLDNKDRLVALAIHLIKNNGFEVDEAVNEIKSSFGSDDSSIEEIGGVNYRVILEDDIHSIHHEEFTDYLERISYNYGKFDKDAQKIILDKCINFSELWYDIYSDFSYSYEHESTHEGDKEYFGAILDELENFRKNKYKSFAEYVKDDLDYDISPYILWDKVEKKLIDKKGYGYILVGGVIVTEFKIALSNGKTYVVIEGE